MMEDARDVVAEEWLEPTAESASSKSTVSAVGCEYEELVNGG